MSSRSGSRADGALAFTAPGALTLADVLRAIQSAPEGTIADPMNLASAVRTVARVLKLPPEAVPAEPSFLRQRLAGVAPVAHGLSDGRWANVRSLLRRALATAGVNTVPGRHLAPLAPAWADLARRLETKALYNGQRRLMSYCSAREIAPAAVDDALMVEFQRALVEESLLGNPRATFLGTISSWNRAVEAVPGWPSQRLATPAKRHGYAQPLAAFPESFRTDVEAWLTRLAGGEGLSTSSSHGVKPITVAYRRLQIRILASILLQVGWPAARLRSLADLVRPAAIEAALQFLLDRQAGKRTTQILNLASTALAVARHWAHLPAADIEQLQLIVRNCSMRPGMTEKNRAMLWQLEDEATVRRLVTLPAALVADAYRSRPFLRRHAVRVQIALAIELLLVAPMRIKNLVNLRLDRHVRRIGAGPRQRLLLELPGDEVKNGLDLTYPLPAETVELFDRYLADAWPLLGGGQAAFLFPGDGGGAKRADTLSGQIIATVERQAGIRITPHQFRHVAGKLYLRANPGGHEVVRAFLGHRSLATTLTFYAGMEQADAARHYDAVIRGLRQAGGRP